MMLHRRAATVLTLLALMLPFTAPARLAPGDAVPALEAETTNGETITLNQFEDKIVVFEWTNHQCPFVRKHYGTGNMQSLQKQATEHGMVWISVISSAKGKQGYVSADKANEIAASKGSNATHIIRDPSGTIGKAFGATATPHIFVADKEGTIAYQGAIDSIASADPEDVAEAHNHVVAAVNAIHKGATPDPQTTQAYGCPVKYDDD